ncbi:MarR family winged helix-turn-helix transcriptional regulator [Geothrix fuzhouensis]|uniref:MarR family winged helix-turn-helix transcriptional regulator n=1 Tax=Geothrix fuzhouensis TaxID=2966451 RepID=UPI0021494D38|nr:MarR family winged helix-turn-helix transcriptional regulator [Geothrix fuzhouensis]
MGSQTKSPPGSDPTTRRVFQALRAIVRDLRLASTSCEKQFGLSAAQLFVLQALRDQPGMSLGEVAARTVTDQSSVSVVVRKLQEKGLVQKGVSTEDARRLELSLTAAGQRLTGQTPPTVQDLLIRRIAGLEPGDRGRLAELLEHLVPPSLEARPMFFEDPPRPARGGRKP